MIRNRITGPEKENGASDGGTFYVPSNEASGKPRFLRAACNVPRFQLRVVYNKTPLSIQYNDVASKGPMTQKKNGKRR